MASRRLRFLFDSPEWAWTALALALRLAFAWKLGSSFYQADEHGFESYGRQLAETGILGTGGRPLAVPPVAPGFFALGFLVLGPKMLGPRLLQAFLGTFVAWALGRCAAALTRSREAGRAALAVACVYPFFIYYGGMLISETCYLALTIPALTLLGLSLLEPSPARSAAGGALLGLAALARPEAAPLALLVFAAMAAGLRREARGPRALALALLCWCLPLLSWCARNRAQVGRFQLDAHGGMTLLHGTMLLEPNEIDTSEAMRVFEKTELHARTKDFPDAERDAALVRGALLWMAEHPEATARGWGTKFLSFWRFYPRPDKVYQEDAGARASLGAPRRLLIALSLLFEPWLILGGLAGLWTLRARRELWPYFAFLVGTMGVHVVSVSQMRYRLPVMPLLILGAAGLLSRALQSETR